MFRSILWIIFFILVSPPDANCQVRENIKFTHITTEDGAEYILLVEDEGASFPS